MKRPWELDNDEVVWMGETLATLTHEQRLALGLYFDSLAVQAYRNGEKDKGAAFEGVEEALRVLIDEALPAAAKAGGVARVEAQGEGGKKKAATKTEPEPEPEDKSGPLDSLPDALDDEDIRAVLAAAGPKSPTLVAPRMSQSRGRVVLGPDTYKHKPKPKRR